MLCSIQIKGCQKNGDEAHNIQTIARAISQSSESTPEWEELDIQLEHPRTDCGYFQLGKVTTKEILLFEEKKRASRAYRSHLSVKK